MGNQNEQAGKSTQDTGDQKFKADLRFVIFILGLAIVGLEMIFNFKALGLGWVGVLAVIVILYLLPAILKNTSKARKKEQAESLHEARAVRQVAELLATLGYDYVVMHDVVSPYGKIDHVVYDKRGNIITIEVKSHEGRVTAWGDQLLLDGHPFEKDIVGLCQKNAIWIRKKVESRIHLNAWITATLVFTNAYVEIGNPIKWVNYMNKQYLLAFIQRTNAGSPAGVKLWETKGKEGPGNQAGGE